ncbi:SDR family NAD(P)-dependent oxidoreductase [Pararhizobium sp. IMCC21322]|uniref:SDR family NAD(P)-dependent oxidoreductase n=1 Tax=Pararhizobium sp. IMCC21322 TaxID=3067903 RepID=UPI0027426F65|nr:SDR family oxidoreductase [Pararhizobium sp. IMCC21322]
MSSARFPDLDGKVVLITGGGSGIGAHLVRGFAEQGASVAFFDIADEPSQALEQELTDAGHSVAFLHCDLTDIPALQASIAQVRDRFGPIGVLVNNAAHDQRHDIKDVTSEYWDERFAVNLKHQFFSAQAVQDDMKKLGGGSIINMGSTSWVMGTGSMPCYTTAKSAVEGLTRSLARIMGPDNIRVNTVLPGWIITKRQEELWLDDEGEKSILENQCLQRKLVPDDMVGPILFLASDAAAACTNQRFIVDGGWV